MFPFWFFVFCLCFPFQSFYITYWSIIFLCKTVFSGVSLLEPHLFQFCNTFIYTEMEAKQQQNGQVLTVIYLSINVCKNLLLEIVEHIAMVIPKCILLVKSQAKHFGSFWKTKQFCFTNTHSKFMHQCT